jgi:hypothetical protein
MTRYFLAFPQPSFYRVPLQMRQEPRILIGLAFLLIFCGVGLAAARGCANIKIFVPGPLIGSIFVLGFVFLGVAISHWDIGCCR